MPLFGPCCAATDEPGPAVSNFWAATGDAGSNLWLSICRAWADALEGNFSIPGEGDWPSALTADPTLDSNFSDVVLGAGALRRMLSC